MTDRDQNEKLFDALLDVAVSQAFQEEMKQLPSNEELNVAYKPSPELDTRIKKHIDKSRRKAKRKHFAKSSGKAVAYIAIVFTLVTTVAFILNPLPRIVACVTLGFLLLSAFEKSQSHYD